MKKLLKYIIKKLTWLIFVLVAISVSMVFSLNYINPPSWMWKIQRQVSPPENYPAYIRHQWADWQNISSQMKLAVIAAEDHHHSAAAVERGRAAGAGRWLRSARGNIHPA